MQSTRDLGRVRSLRRRLVITPEPADLERSEDLFGNTVHRFSLEFPHNELVITASGTVRVDCTDPDVSAAQKLKTDELREAVKKLTGDSAVDVGPFRFDSPRIRCNIEFREYAEKVTAQTESVMDAVLKLNAAIHEEFRYDKDATEVHTPTETAFRLRRGVCQDFAHVAVACLRSAGLPARYVSGYLRTIPPEGKPRLVGADESHAWFSVWLGADTGWIDFDPTNNCMCGTDHIPIAFGRDYSDVIPVRGVYLGGGDTSMTVSVDVAPIT